LSLGTNKYNTGNRKTFISEQFLGTPTLVITDQPSSPAVPGDPPGPDEPVGNIIVGRKLIDNTFKLQTMRTYLYVEEEQ
jgi:type IV pilus assembly protein PilY1